MATRKVIPIEPMTPETKCGFCTNSKCCTYISQQIETPRSKRDFDFLLWQISHRDIRIYKDEGSWYLLVDADVELKPDGAYRLDAQIQQKGDVPDAVAQFLSTFAEYRSGSYRLDWSDSL